MWTSEDMGRNDGILKIIKDKLYFAATGYCKNSYPNYAEIIEINVEDGVFNNRKVFDSCANDISERTDSLVLKFTDWYSVDQISN